MDQLNNQPSFNFADNDYEKKQELFDKICDEKKFDDVNNDDQWVENDDFEMEKSDWLIKKKHISSSSSDEDDEEEDPRNLCIESNTTDRKF